MHLVTLLNAAKQDIDFQNNRIRKLEQDLEHEQKARKKAERHARGLWPSRKPLGEERASEPFEDDEFAEPLDSLELMDHNLPNAHKDAGLEQDDLLKSSASMETLKSADDLHRETEVVDASTSRLQARLDLMIMEMNEMKSAMDSYKRRAEDAEEGRRSLAEMVENIRAGRERSSTVTTDGDTSTLIGSGSGSGSSSSKDLATQQHDANYGLWTSHRHKNMPNGKANNGDMHHRELEKTLSNVLQQQRNGLDEGGRLVQSAPYVSMVGVVLIGVGIMTWLNGWQSGGAER